MSDAKPGIGNFLSAGSSELRRQYDRFSLKQKQRQLEAERDKAVLALGEKAWDAKIDLTPFADVRDQLQGAAARSGELAATAGQLETQKAALEGERRDAIERGKVRRDAVEAKKRPVDTSLSAARNRQANSERERALAQARLAAIANELVRPPAGAQPPVETPEQRQARLLTEQGVVRGKLAASEAELPELMAQIAQLQTESANYAGEIATIVAEQNQTLARLDGELGRMRSGLQAASQAQHQVGKERSDLYRKLGQGLFSSEMRPQVLDESFGRIAAIDASRSDVGTRLNASIAETQSLPQGTMTKFWGTVVGVPLVAIALVWGAASLLPLASQAPPAPQETIAEPANLAPQDEKDGTVLRFIQAGARSDEQTREDAVRILREDLLTMGASADQSHLPVLARVLRSRESDLREAAANAMGMIGPTANETNALAQLLKDPEPPVARAARRALEASRDPAVPALLANASGGK